MRAHVYVCVHVFVQKLRMLQSVKSFVYFSTIHRLLG